MKHLHLECKPDETIAKTLGKAWRLITHHNDKGRIMKKLAGGLAAQYVMVDEDPQSAKHNYEKKLILMSQEHGLKIYTDKHQNKVIMLCPRLEEWLIDVATKMDVDIKKFGLPTSANELHDVINHRLEKVKQLIDHLNEVKAPGIVLLKASII